MRMGTYKAAVVTVSDTTAAGEREDASGPAAVEILEGADIEVAAREAVADEQEEIEEVLLRLCERDDIDLIITTGGTGFGPRDVTPEATSAVIDRQAHNLAEYMRVTSIGSNPKAALSRGVAGIRGKTLIVNLPGSPAAVEENLKSLIKVLDHALLLLAGGAPH